MEMWVIAVQVTEATTQARVEGRETGCWQRTGSCHPSLYPQQLNSTQHTPDGLTRGSNSVRESSAVRAALEPPTRAGTLACPTMGHVVRGEYKHARDQSSLRL